MQAKLGGSAGLWETQEGQGGGGWATGSHRPRARVPLTWRRVLGGSGASGLAGRSRPPIRGPPVPNWVSAIGTKQGSSW